MEFLKLLAVFFLFILYGCFKQPEMKISNFKNIPKEVLVSGPEWILVMQANRTNSPTTATWNTTAATGTYSNDYSTTFKLSDVDINALAVNQEIKVIFSLNNIEYVRYYRDCAYSHTTKVTDCRVSYATSDWTGQKVAVNDWPLGGLWDGDASWLGNVATNAGGTYGHTWCIEQGDVGRNGYCWDNNSHYEPFGAVTDAKWQMWVR